MYLTVQEVNFDSISGQGLENGLWKSGLSRAPLNLTMKKKHPKNTPWVDDPGRDRVEEVAPLNLMTMDLSVR